MPKNLTALFSPKSVVVIGASRSPEKVGAVVLKNIIDSKYPGKIYAVNPNTEAIGNIKCFKTVLDLPEVPDLAVVAIPAQFVLETISQIMDKGIKNVVVLSAGFKETGPDGANLEKQLEDLCKKGDINLLGPNCLGFVNNLCPINATFAKVSPKTGNLRFISQSGALATSLFDWFSSVDLGFSEFVTLGNKTIINENDILEYYLAKDQGPIQTLMEEETKKTAPIGMYLEAISDGQRFLKLAGQLTKNNPMFILKPGKTKAAATAMQSHTGAIAGADDILNVALNQARVYRCQTLEQFFDLSKAFSWGEIPLGPRVAIISNAGGPAVISTDAIVSEGLEMAEFDETTTQKLSEVLPRSASILDPIDVLGDALANRFAKAAEIVLQTDKCNSLLVILTPQIMTQVEKTAEMIGNISKKYKKPVFCSFIGGNLVSEGEKGLNKLKVPSFLFPERAIKVIGAMWEFKKKQEQDVNETLDIGVLNTQILPDKSSEILQKAIKNSQQTLDSVDANGVVSLAGIQTPPSKIAVNLKDALKTAKDISYPVVLKLSSPDILHKKNLGGVVLNITDDQQLKDSWKTLEKRIKELDEAAKKQVQIQIQKEIPDGVEVLVGIKKDPTFGPVLLFGAGGSLTELIADKNLRLLPVDVNTIKELIKESKIYSSLKGGGDGPPQSLDKLSNLIFDLCKIYEAAPEIQELEINPIIVSENDVWAVDTKIIMEKSKPKSEGPKFKEAKTLKTERLADKTRYFEFETKEPFVFKPGQYISVKVSDTRINCYSIAGQTSPTKFNLLVDSNPGGPGSKFFESLKSNDKISYLGPFGTFTLKADDRTENVLFLATGCGLAPVKSMIEHLLNIEKSKQNIVLYIGYTNYEDILMNNYLESLLTKFSNFKYKVVVYNKNDKWKGLTGFITAPLKSDFPDASKCSAYLCGKDLMIRDATKILLENKCPPEKIYFEKYER